LVVSFGRQMIASSIAALKERVIDGADGFTFPVGDVGGLADLMASRAGNENQWIDAEMLDAHEFRPQRQAGAPLAAAVPKPAARAAIAESRYAGLESAPALPVKVESVVAPPYLRRCRRALRVRRRAYSGP
jgi:hypothetical protein